MIQTEPIYLFVAMGTFNALGVHFTFSNYWMDNSLSDFVCRAEILEMLSLYFKLNTLSLFIVSYIAELYLFHTSKHTSINSL